MPKTSFLLRSSLALRLCAAMALVALGDILFFQRNLGGGAIGVYALAMLAAVVSQHPALWRDLRAWCAVAAAALFGFALIYDTGPLAWSMFWTAIAMAALLPATARFDDGWRWFQRLFLHGLRIPVGPLLDALRLHRLRRKTGKDRLGLSAAAPVLALPVFGSAIILALFAAANPVLEDLLAGIVFFDLSLLSIGRLILWGLLFFSAWSLIHPRPTQRLLPTFDGSGDLPLPGVSVASVRLSLIAFNLLFAIQNLMDFAYLGGFVPMPEGVSMTDYVHRGAYPLIGTALLAAAFVLVTLRPGSTTASVPAIRAMVVLWIVQNMLLVASSAWRTLDYIEASMLTNWRIAALIWMGLVALGLGLICWRMLRGRSASWLINANLGAAALVLAICCFVDIGAIAARWNVRHIRNIAADRPAIDLCYLNALGSSALLPLIALEKRDELQPVFREQVQSVRLAVLRRLKNQIDGGEWTILAGQRLTQARAALAGLPPPRLRPGPRGCDGALLPPPPKAQTADPAPFPVVTPTPTGSALPVPSPTSPALTGEKP